MCFMGALRYDASADLVQVEVTVAPWPRVVKALGSDLIFWLSPWAVFGVVALFAPSFSAWWITVFVLAAICCGLFVLSAERVFARYGYTSGMQRNHLRATDPLNDGTLWKARLYKKSLLKLVIGKYQIMDVGEI
jgi:hypothetical protein